VLRNISKVKTLTYGNWWHISYDVTASDGGGTPQFVTELWFVRTDRTETVTAGACHSRMITSSEMITRHD